MMQRNGPNLRLYRVSSLCRGSEALCGLLSKCPPLPKHKLMKLKSLFPTLVLLVALGGLVSFMLAPQGYQVGDKVTDFSLKNIDGQMVSLQKNAGKKGAIVIFTCNHCPYSVRYEDRIVALDKKYAPLGFPVVAINPNDVKRVPEDSYEAMQVRAKEKGFTFPYLVDETQDVAKAFGAERTPHVYIVTREGNGFKVSYIGAIDNNANDAKAVTEKYAEQALDALIAGKAPKSASTKAIGCTIKWKNS